MVDESDAVLDMARSDDVACLIWRIVVKGLWV